MINNTVIKVYNKEGKLNTLIRNTDSYKVVSIYKYNGENVDVHSFISSNEGYELKSWQAYYELRSEEKGKAKCIVTISNEFIEQVEHFDDLEVVVTTTNLNSGNVYKKKTKYFDGEKYVIEFKNDELYDFPFKVHENKIKEYLKKLSNRK